MEGEKYLSWFILSSSIHPTNNTSPLILIFAAHEAIVEQSYGTWKKQDGPGYILLYIGTQVCILGMQDTQYSGSFAPEQCRIGLGTAAASHRFIDRITHIGLPGH